MKKTKNLSKKTYENLLTSSADIRKLLDIDETMKDFSCQEDQREINISNNIKLNDFLLKSILEKNEFLTIFRWDIKEVNLRTLITNLFEYGQNIKRLNIRTVEPIDGKYLKESSVIENICLLFFDRNWDLSCWMNLNYLHW